MVTYPERVKSVPSNRDAAIVMTVKDDVIKAMKEAGKPMSAGEVEKATGIDRKEIDKAFKELKAEGAIVSPVRCKWEPAQ